MDNKVPFPWLAAYAAGVPARIETPPYRLLGEMAPDLAARRPAARAFTTVMPNGMAASLTFAEVDRTSDAFAAYLRETLRLEPGARVAIQIPNGLAYPVAAFGIFKAGCVLVNVNPLYTAHEMAHVFADAEPSAIVSIDMFADTLAAAMEEAPVPHVILTQAASLFPMPSRRLIGFVQKYVKKQVPYPRFRHAIFSKALALGAASIRAGANVKGYTSQMEPSAIACLQYTGGTTGVSKGAMLTHRNLLMNVAQVVAFRGDDMRESDHVLTALPLYHIFAFNANLLGFFIGAHNILIPSPRPLTNLRKAFETQAITLITGVNTLFNGLLNQPWFCANPPKSLRVSLAGGMALQEPVALRWRKITGTEVTEGYGLTEASPVLTLNPAGREKPGSIGVPLPSTEMKCVDDQGNEVAIGEPGEIIARGPQIMQGYWKQPKETKQVLRDGWLFTGDIGRMDADGYFSIVDRRKDMIVVSGFKVFPNEVEAVLAGLAGVKECAVIGVPDAASGEAVKAFVVRGDPDLDAEAVRDFCRSKLAGYKVPKFVVFCGEDLPKSNVGKNLRKDLRDVILVSGFMVFPNEVEEVLAGLAGVKECAVTGVPDAASGEAVKAFVVRGDPDLDAEAVRDFCRSKLAGYKVPKFVVFCEDLRRSNVGKNLREDLKDVILVSGFIVYPIEVEVVLDGLAGVKECAVIGMPDEETGEAVKAFIVRGDPALDASTVRDFCKSELADHEVPKFIEFREDLEDL
jgi:long-chain acyl-CoA synthetase